jgi:hypothetical protein
MASAIILQAVCGHREVMRDPFAAAFATKAWWYARGQLPYMQELVATQQALRHFSLGYIRSLTRDLRMSVFGMRDWLGQCTQRGLDDHGMGVAIAHLYDAEAEREQNAIEDAWYNQH